MRDPVFAARWRDLNSRPTSSRFSLATVRAAWWAWRALRRARRDLEVAGVSTKVPPPPLLPWSARNGVHGVLRRTSPTCLEGALVLQAWLMAHDVDLEVVVGVAPRTEDEPKITAHAWVDQITPAREWSKYKVIHRIAPR